MLMSLILVVQYLFALILYLGKEKEFGARRKDQLCFQKHVLKIENFVGCLKFINRIGEKEFA